MNTTIKGDEFEKFAYNYISKLIENNELILIGKNCKVFTKKKYFSKDRNSNIIVDISVEHTSPGEPMPNAYLMIECKNYNKKVPVDDIEEFYAKTQQITGLNVKAIFLTTSLLQPAALDFAISKKIRVMLISPNSRTTVLSFRKENSFANNKTQDYTNAIISLTSETRSQLVPTMAIGIGPSVVYQSIKELLNESLSSLE